MDRILISTIALIVVICFAVAGTVFFPAFRGREGPSEMSAAEDGCLASGGTVGEAVCCLSSEDFPNSCLVGVCGCSAENSHAVKTCNCPAGRCFNGTVCVMAIGSFKECVAAGYSVIEVYPRQCRVPGGPSFVEQSPPTLTAESCQAARGHWTECGSRCQLDNTGKTGIACPTICEALCECGGIAGFGCPEGYICRLPAGIADALGYCVAGRS